jgi:hypothetical protein
MAFSTRSKTSPLLSFFWEELRVKAPMKVSRACCAQYDRQREIFILPVLNENYIIDPVKQKIKKDSAHKEDVGFMWALLLLNYLIKSRDLPLAGRLVSEQEFIGGEFFFRGLHSFDHSLLEQRYAGDKKGFLEAGLALGGKKKPMGDAAIELWPLPRVPLIYILWLGDEEFPVKIQVLFDASAEHQLPADMIWNMVNLVNRRLLDQGSC